MSYELNSFHSQFAEPLNVHSEKMNISDIRQAQKRISPWIRKTPLLSSSNLNEAFGHEFIFKAECLQTTHAFKIRGALNALAALQEKGTLPDEVVTYSSGNHAQAVAWAARHFSRKARVFMAEATSEKKKQGTLDLGAALELCASRQDAEEKAHRAAQRNNSVLVPPFDDNNVIAGQGTVSLESLEEEPEIDAIFAPCGGGGLLSGTHLVANHFGKLAFGAEPTLGNDAAKSLRSGEIFQWTQMPNTIADGARTLSVSPKTLSFLQKLDGFFEISEEEILYWTQWLRQLLKVSIEPTASLGMAAAVKWIKSQPRSKKILIILSGGNTDQATEDLIYQKDYLASSLISQQASESGENQTES